MVRRCISYWNSPFFRGYVGFREGTSTNHSQNIVFSTGFDRWTGHLGSDNLGKNHRSSQQSGKSQALFLLENLASLSAAGAFEGLLAEAVKARISLVVFLVEDYFFLGKPGACPLHKYPFWV